MADLPSRQSFLEAERGKWLSVQEAAFVLRTTRDTIACMIHNGTLPHRRCRKQVVRIHLDDLRPHQGGPHGLTQSDPIELPRGALHRQSPVEVFERPVQGYSEDPSPSDCGWSWGTRLAVGAVAVLITGAWVWMAFAFLDGVLGSLMR